MNKIIEYENGEKLVFRYEGSTPSEEAIEQAEQFLNDKDHSNMYRNVVYFRTIFKECEEKQLVISYMDTIGNYEKVKYNDGKLVIYRCKKEINDMVISVKSTQNIGFQVSFQNFDNDFIEYSNSRIVDKHINDTLLTISSLKKVKGIDISEDANKMIEIYRLFYNENPDFSDSDINKKIQSMMCILDSFDISLGDKYQYDVFGGKDNPFSMGLESLVLTLRPLGKIIVSKDSEYLSDVDKKKIETIGNSIREVSTSDQILELSKVFYIEKNYGNLEKMNLPENINIDSDTINSNLKKVKSTKEKVNNK